jgi:hypothetical protein
MHTTGKKNVAGAKNKRKLSAAGAAAVALCLASFAPARRLIAGQVAPAAHTDAAVEQPAPFRVGEALDYRVEWSAFSNAAQVILSIPERRNLYGWRTWHFRAAIHTLASVRSLFEIDDQFDSYADVSAFESRQFEEYLSELGRHETHVMHFVSSGSGSREGSNVPAPTVVVRPGTRDPLDALYDLRAIDWDRTPEFHTSVYDGKNMYQMVARRDEANEPVTTAAGQFSTSRISIQVYQYQRLVTAIHFEIWLANDATRAPVLMRADLPFGNLRVELVSAQF